MLINEDDGYRYYIKLLNIKNKGSVIYTGSPDFNERYLAKRSTIFHRLYNVPVQILATREQELEAKAQYFELIADAGLPFLKKHFNRKLINHPISQKPRKSKPTKSELIIFREKYEYDNAKIRGWIKAASREFNLDAKTINVIIKE